MANTDGWREVAGLAKAAGAKYPDLVAAQWALESGWGKHTSGINNFFGLKGSGSNVTTQEVVNGETITIKADFLNFRDLAECVGYLVDRWYKDFKNYKGINNAADIQAAAEQLVKQGYATDPDYHVKVLRLVESHGEAAAPSKPAKVAAAPAAFTIEANQRTWLKKKPIQAQDLSDGDRKACGAGQTYGVAEWHEQPASGHVEVALAHGAGTWFIYQPHWSREATKGPAAVLLGPGVTPSIDWRNHSLQLTPNLTVGEVLQNDPRRAPAAGSSAEGRILRTAREYQAMRDAWGGPIGVTSFYRPEPINQQVGGVPGSRHVSGEAMDVYPIGRGLEEFYRWIRQRWSGGLGDGRARGFIHLDTRGGGGFVPGAGVRPYVEFGY